MEPQEGTMTGVQAPGTISTKQARIAALARRLSGTAIHSLSHHMDMDWLSVAKQARILGWKLRGHYAYYGIRGNAGGIGRFDHEVRRLWFKWLGRRSQRARMTWPVFAGLLRRHPLPPPRLRPRGRQLRLVNP